MKYVFFALNIIVDLAGHFLMFLIWRHFFGLESIYLQFAIATLLMGGVFLSVIAPLLVHWRDNSLTRSLYLVVGLWTGVILNTALVAAFYYLLVYLGFIETNSWTTMTKSIYIGFIPMLMLLPEAWSAQAHKVKRLTVKIKDLPDAWIGLDVIHISDIHLGPIWRQRFYDKLVRKVNSLEAAAIFITGDLFDGMDGDFSWFKQRKFAASLGVFYSFGNHDLILGKEKVRILMAGSDIQILDNDIKEIMDLQILGVTCYYEGRQDLKAKILALDNYQPNKPSIMMYHEPQDIGAARTAGINLQLSGHTHGGQMFPFNLLAHLLYRGFGSGLYRLHNYSISVSSGVGTWGPPLRLGSRSEILVLKLLKA